MTTHVEALKAKATALLHELSLWQDSIHPMPLHQHMLDDACEIINAFLALEASQVVSQETVDETFLRLKGKPAAPQPDMVEALKAALNALKPFAEAALPYEDISGVFSYKDNTSLAESPRLENRLTVGDLRRAAEAYAALEASALSTEDGFVRVPREPTDAMIDAAISAGSETYDGGYEAATEREIYRAMIAAAPAPASNGEAVVEALKLAAKQKLSIEMHSTEWNSADFEGGYNDIVKLARAALSAINKTGGE